MKILACKTLLIAALLWASGLLAQPKIAFSDEGFARAGQQAKKTGKPIFYMVYASWCSHCNKMKSEVFTDAAVVDFLNKNFVCAWQDIDKEGSEFFKQHYAVRSFPYFFFFDANATLLYRFNGEYQSAAFIAEAKNALITEKQLPYLQQQFADNPTDAKKCLDLLSTMIKGTERKNLNVYAQQYLASQTDAELISEINWKIIANGVSDIESHAFQFVLQHREDFEKVSSPKRVQRKFANIVTELLDPYTETLDTLNYKKQREIAKTLSTRKTDSIVFRYDIAIAEKAQNWNSYRKTTLEDAEKYAWTDAKLLHEIALTYQKNINGVQNLGFAIKLVNRAIELNDSYDNELLAARLYEKSNDYKQALAFAQKARKRNADVGFNTKEADELLLRIAQNKTDGPSH